MATGPLIAVVLGEEGRELSGDWKSWTDVLMGDSER
jgi:hypothetical protein